MPTAYAADTLPDMQQFYITVFHFFCQLACLAKAKVFLRSEKTIKSTLLHMNAYFLLKHYSLAKVAKVFKAQA